MAATSRYSRVLTITRLVALASFLALAGLIYVRYTQVIADVGTLTSAQRVGAAIQQVLESARDADLAARGFAITGREDFSDRHAAAKARLRPQIDRLRAALPDEPQQRQRGELLLQQLNRLTDATDQILDARRQAGPDEARATMLATDEPGVLNALRDTAESLQAVLRQRVADERAASGMSRRVTGYLMLGTFVLAVGMLGYAGWQVQRELRRRGRAEGDLLVANADIEYEVRERNVELLRANARLESNERQLRLVADFGPVHLLATDTDGAATYISAGFSALTGMTPHDVLGLGWTAAVHPDDRDALVAKWPVSTATATPFECDFRLRTAAGEYRSFKLRAMPSAVDHGPVTEWFGAMIDVHDQHEMASVRADLLRREQVARADAEMANRIKDDFLAAVSHELRTPLNAIVGWAHILKIDTGENRARAVEAIERNALVQARLIDDLLDLSRLTRGRFGLTLSTIDLGTAVQSALVTIGPAAAAKRVTITVRADENVCVRGDDARLQQVAWNLLSNAVKFTPQGGQVTVDVSRLGYRARLRVADTGEGIDPEFLPHVFEPFRQGDGHARRLGLGLGLSIVRQIVELHGGSILAASDGPHQGSSFTVVLPLSEVAAPATPVASGPPRQLSVRVLVVEDDEDSAVTLSALLAHHGCDVRIARSVAEAETEFKLSRPDVLLCDIGLPDGDGYTLLRRLRAASDRVVPAIALTAFAREEDRARALDAGFAAYLTKPYDADQLFDTLFRVTAAKTG